MPKATQVDLSEFYRLSRPRKPPCRVAFARSQLSEDDRTKLDAAIAIDPGIITAASILEWLAARGHEVTSSAVAVHRKTVLHLPTPGKCSCADES